MSTTKLYIGSAASTFKIGGADCHIYLGDELMYPISSPSSGDYLTFEALDDNFTFQCTSALSYSLDDGVTWTSLAANTSSPSMSSGDTVMLKNTTSIQYGNNVGRFSTVGHFKAKGNPSSIYYGDAFTEHLDSVQAQAFYDLFYNCSGLTDASELSLTATYLSTSCYREMFYNCTGLTSAPALPATSLDQYCYSHMFAQCYSLTSAPALPATTLAPYCYQGMFFRCTGLTSVPELPATTLKPYCYSDMFGRCYSLTEAPELPATTFGGYGGCYERMFEGCTGLTTAPELKIATLTTACYAKMFSGCTNISAITCLATDISASACTSGWTDGVSATGVFTKAASMTGWTTGSDGIPSGWTVTSQTQTYSLPDVPFSINYNAKNSTLSAIEKTSGQLADVNAVFSGDSVVILSDYLQVTGTTLANFNGYQTYMNRTDINPNMTIVSKARTIGNDGSLLANRDGMGSYNWMYRQYSDHLTLHGDSETGQISCSTSVPSILSVRISAGTGNGCDMLYNNWTSGTSSSEVGFQYGYENTNAGCSLFSGDYTGQLEEQWEGEFYWIYMTQNVLTDEQIQQVIDYNEHL